MIPTILILKTVMHVAKGTLPDGWDSGICYPVYSLLRIRLTIFLILWQRCFALDFVYKNDQNVFCCCFFRITLLTVVVAVVVLGQTPYRVCLTRVLHICKYEQ